MKELRQAKSRYEFALETRQAVLIVSGLILVIMLSFLMGTLFGKNLTKMSGQRALVASYSDELGAPEEVADAGQVIAEAKERIQRNDNTSQELTKETSTQSPARAAYIRELENMKVPTEVKKENISNDSADPPVLAALTPQKPIEDKTVSRQENEKKVTVIEQKTAPTKEIKKPVIPVGSYTIQLASFPEKVDAAALVNDLRTKQFDAYMLHINLPGKGSFYRVRLGHYKDLGQAEKARRILQTREGKFYDAWITQ